MAHCPVVVTSARYQCDIGPHVFPVGKYGLILKRLLAEGAVAPADVLEPELPSRTEVRVPVVLSPAEWSLYEDTRLAVSDLETSRAKMA